MDKFMVFLHVIGSAGLGFYVLLPFLVSRATQLSGSGQEGLADGLLNGNRIAQYFLVLQLLTGGYLISKASYTVMWMVLVLLLFLAMSAVAGIMAKPMKRIVASLQAGQSATAHIKRTQTMSIIVLVLYGAIIYLMKYPFYKI
ncbi:hypothetical protein EBB07_01115 [Paenibacillaceae bacterium]|nr:hypothetical protein EBB07_01115 [Paenibacillaceae bacterium]